MNRHAGRGAVDVVFPHLHRQLAVVLGDQSQILLAKITGFASHFLGRKPRHAEPGGAEADRQDQSQFRRQPADRFAIAAGPQREQAQ